MVIETKYKLSSLGYNEVKIRISNEKVDMADNINNWATTYILHVEHVTKKNIKKSKLLK